MNLLTYKAAIMTERDRAAENRGRTAAPSHLARPGSRGRLLLVDDNAEGRRALARILEIYQFDVTAVGEGVAAVERLESDPAFDVVLTDLLLPDLDGREVAERAHALQPAPLVVMITGWDFSPDEIRHEEWGIDRVFLKPLNVAELIATLDEHKAAR